MTHSPDLAVVPALRNERFRSMGALAHEDVLQSLKAHRLPARLLYDPAGFELLERAWEDPAFYPARLERELLNGHLADWRRGRRR